MANDQRLNLSRNQLASFLPDHASIRQFEDLFDTTNSSAENIDVISQDVTTLQTDIVQKVDNTRIVGVAAPLTGGGDLSGDITITLPKAESGVDGYLDGADWDTFNGKQAALGFTPANKAGETFTGPVSASSLSTTVYLVAGLPAGSAGMRAFVSNALGPAFGAAVVGGGAVGVPVYHDGVSWKVG